MSSIMRCRNGDIGLVIGELQLYELHMHPPTIVPSQNESANRDDDLGSVAEVILH
jgi:hypothetical protein